MDFVISRELLTLKSERRIGSHLQLGPVLGAAQGSLMGGAGQRTKEAYTAHVPVGQWVDLRLDVSRTSQGSTRNRVVFCLGG